MCVLTTLPLYVLHSPVSFFLFSGFTKPWHCKVLIKITHRTRNRLHLFMLRASMIQGACGVWIPLPNEELLYLTEVSAKMQTQIKTSWITPAGCSNMMAPQAWLNTTRTWHHNMTVFVQFLNFSITKVFNNVQSIY